MLENILAQPRSLAAVLRQQTGEGAGALAEAARLLRSADGRVVISGMGASLFAAMPAAAAMERRGVRTLLAESSELLHHGAESWRAGDVAVLISRSGASAEVLRLAEQMHAAGRLIVAVTAVPDSPLARLGTAVVLTTSPADDIADQIVAVQSYTATLLTMGMLAEQAGGAGSTGRIAGALDALLPALPAYLSLLVEESEAWEPFLAGGRSLYLLGRGAAFASAHEGSLLFHETAKLPAIVFSSGQFRHGPVEAISPGVRVIVVGSPAATRSLDASLATDLARMGAEVRWIGPRPETHAGVEMLAPWPDETLTERQAATLAPLLEVLPLQVAAYRAALWRDIVPGDFRYAAEVTSGEVGFPLLPGSGV